MSQYDDLFEIFRQRGAHDVYFPPGWTAIMERLHSGLMEIDPGYRISQVKVKFGGLRVYLASAAPSEAHDLITQAEADAARTCEFCGEPGIPRRGQWTLCDEHSEGREAVAQS